MGVIPSGPSSGLPVPSVATTDSVEVPAMTSVSGNWMFATPFASVPATAAPTVRMVVSDEVAVASAPSGGATASPWSSVNERMATALAESTVRGIA